MTIKQRLLTIERALLHRTRSGTFAAYMEHFMAEAASGRVLCRDGVSRSLLQWLHMYPDVENSMQQIEYGKAVEAVKKGEPIAAETKKFIRSYLVWLDHRYRNGEDQEFYKRICLEIRQVRAAKVSK